MSIYSALRSGVSALTANSSAMAVISDNIANVNTVGFKGAKTDFISLLNDQSSGSHYNPGGVIADTRRLVNTQGTIQSTSSSTDLAISGNGFFVVSRDNLPASIGDGVAFTRAGSFSLDRSGYLANGEGFYLQGWPMQDDGTFLTSPTSLSTLEAISIANVTATAEATQNVSVRANLASDEEDYDGAEGAYAVGAMAGNTITPDFESSIEVYDSLGAARTLNLSFLKTAANTWQVEIYSPDAATTNGLVASGTVTFGANGLVSTISPGLAAPAAFDWQASTGAAAQTIAYDFADTLSQFATTYTISAVDVDGVPPGTLSDLRLEEDGVLSATFTNGRARALYKIPVATFSNPDSLAPDRGGVFLTTLESGPFILNSSNTGRAGEIKSAALEASNVDLASEFTTMIITQRAYSASSKVITTADQMLEELISIKR